VSSQPVVGGHPGGTYASNGGLVAQSHKPGFPLSAAVPDFVALSHKLECACAVPMRRGAKGSGRLLRSPYRMRLSRFAVLLAVAAVAGCGAQKQGAQQLPQTTAAPPTTTAQRTTAPTTAPAATTLELFFLAPDGQLVASTRKVEHTEAPGAAALHELMSPPAGATTQVPDGLALTIANGKAQVTGATLDAAALAQVVYTLTSFPTVDSVNGKTRKDVEAFVPAILVEHPTAGETVKSPLRVTGTANTFEATFEYRLEDAAGKALAHHVVTATSGSGERGTFDFTVPFTVDAAQDGTLAVYELSAQNGAVVHERDIPLRLVP
jgi:germination protein M